MGSIHRAVVESVRPFGVFVKLPGVSRSALVPANGVDPALRFSREDPDEDKVKALEWACPRGGPVYVKVTEVGEDPGGRGLRIACLMTACDQATGADLDPLGALLRGPAGGGSDEAPDLGSIHRATVAEVRPFGIFVRLPGFRRNGLVHSSQVSEHMGLSREDTDEEKVAALSGVVALGDAVWVKVVELTPAEEGRGPKVGCSMKLVAQGTGADLDPAGTHYRPRGAGRGGGDDDDGPGRAAMAAVRAGVVDWGHHAADIRSKGGVAYELVPSDDEGPAAKPGDNARMVARPSAMAAVGGGVALAGHALVAAPELAFGSVEEAQAVLDKYQRKEAKKAAKKAAKKEAKRERKDKKSRRRSCSSDSDT